MTNVQIRLIIVILKLDDVYVLISAKESIAINACQIRTDGSIRKDVKTATAITSGRLAIHVNLIVASVCVAKDLLDENAINVQSAISIILTVTAATVIVMVH